MLTFVVLALSASILVVLALAISVFLVEAFSPQNTVWQTSHRRPMRVTFASRGLRRPFRRDPRWSMHPWAPVQEDVLRVPSDGENQFGIGLPGDSDHDVIEMVPSAGRR